MFFYPSFHLFIDRFFSINFVFLIVSIFLSVTDAVPHLFFSSLSASLTQEPSHAALISKEFEVR